MTRLKILMFYTGGYVIVMASAGLQAGYPSRQLEISGGMFLALAVLWSIPLAMIIRQRAAERKAERFKALLRATSQIPPRPEPPQFRPAMGGRLAEYAGLEGR